MNFYIKLLRLIKIKFVDINAFVRLFIMKHNSPIIIIAGPTASGKSSFAIHLAKLINGSIINFDSMQVYKDLEILTARPSKDDLDTVPHKLYGFVDLTERDWFRILITVQGVGTKVALGLLSILAPEKLLHAIAATDKAAMTRAPGVGPKLATRILTELKDKVGDLSLNQAAQQISAASVPVDNVAAAELNDAASALVNLGYSYSEALGAVASVIGRNEDTVSVEKLIRDGLTELAGLNT